ncbi:hypothetical protein SCHPADRAFT_806800, partial [Schizopora paradoxa]
DNIPEWDGNPDTLANWILKVNSLSKRSPIIFKQLGQIVPTRLVDEADDWYYSLPQSYRTKIEEDWETLKEAIASYYMNRSWFDKQKTRANKAYYREPGHHTETPSEYYIRKSQLLSFVYQLNDSQMIMEVLTNAPSAWVTIVTPHFCRTVVEFQAALKFHEEALIDV